MNQYDKCTEYIGDYYGIQPTRSGEFIVRQRDGRELSRFPTIDGARADIQERQLADAQAREHRLEQWAGDREFSFAHSDLTDAQLRWQDWRNWFYNELVHEDRSLAQHERALDRIPNGEIGEFGTTGSPSFANHERHYIDDAKRQKTAHDVYSQACALDKKIKQARRDQDVDALSDLLLQSEQMIKTMSGFFLSIARPDDAKPRLNFE